MAKKNHNQLTVSLLIANLLICWPHFIMAQSIGYQTNFNPFGFNPYMSPVYGYGLGMPYGSYGLNALKNPWLLQMASSPFSSGTSFGGKFHAKSILKKLGYEPYGSSYPYYSSPYSYNYGYGKHYGAGQVANNPYKSAYGDYYSTSGSTANDLSSYKTSAISTAGSSPYYDPNPLTMEPQHEFLLDKHAIIKPLIKAGAILTTAAILGKKKLDLVPPRLNPSGMILNSH